MLLCDFRLERHIASINRPTVLLTCEVNIIYITVHSSLANFLFQESCSDSFFSMITAKIS